MRKLKFVRAYNGNTAIGDTVELTTNSHFDYTIDPNEEGKIRVNGTLESPYVLNIVDVNTSDTTVLEEVDFGGLTIYNTNPSTTVVFPNYIRKIKNLNLIVARFGKTGADTEWPSVKGIREFYGNITIDGQGQGKVWLDNFYDYNTYGIEKAKGSLNIRNIKEFGIGIITNSQVYQYSDVLDIRNVDTTGVTRLGILYNMLGPCTVIIGNLTNESVTNLINSSTNKPDRILVCTTQSPPPLKNCTISDNTPVDAYDSTYDWVNKGNFIKILVPPGCANTYKTNTYVQNGVVGNTGWSKYANIIEEYNEGDYEPKEEWIYRTTD